MRILLGVLVVLAACGGDDANSSGDDVVDAMPDPADGWRTAAPVGGGAIQETATVAVDGKIYVLGGFDGDLAIRDSVQIFDVATQTWSDGPALPEEIHHGNAAVVDGTIYVVGFMTTFQFTARGEVWAWNPASDAAWSTRTSMPAGTGRGAAIVGAIDGIIYVAGGLRGGAAVPDVSAYDPADDAWDDTVADLPVPRDHGCGGVLGGALVVAGGRQADIGSTSDQTFALTPGAGWTERAAMITGRGGTACGVIDERLIVVGGEGNPDTASGVYPQAEAYDADDDAWTALPPMPRPRHGMGAAAWDGSLYVPGGATVEAFGASDQHDVFTP